MTNECADGSNEREFLHDLATPLGTAMFLTDSTLEDFQARPDAEPDDIMRLGEIFQALEQIKMLMSERREILVKRGVPSART